MTPVTANLKKHLAQAYGMPAHLKAAFDKWIDEVDVMLVHFQEGEQPAPPPPMDEILPPDPDVTEQPAVEDNGTLAPL